MLKQFSRQIRCMNICAHWEKEGEGVYVIQQVVECEL